MTNALRALLPGYGLPPDAPLRLLNRSENETWLAGDGDTLIVLRHHRAGYHSRAEIASELAWLAALQGHTALRCPRPLSDHKGEMILTAGGRHVVAFAHIAGREPRAEDDLAPWFEALGEATAHLHAHARRWPRPPGFARKRWDTGSILGPRAHWGDWRAAPGLDREAHPLMARLAAELTSQLDAYGHSPDRFGLIHADLRLTNLLIDESGLWVIDFDDCGFGWAMYDFAAAVSFIETDPRLPDLACRWCAGYGRVAPLTAADVAILPVLVMLRRVLLTAWLGTRADSETAREIGPAGYTSDTLRLAERFLSVGPAGFLKG